MPLARRRQLARIAAPAAFLVAATIAVLIIRSALHADEDRGGAVAPVARTATGNAAPTTTRRRATTARRPATPEPTRVYVIESGDTLATIADEHGTSVERLLELNPRVDPVSLSVGQRIRVPAG